MKVRAGPFSSSSEEGSDDDEDFPRPPCRPVVDHRLELGEALLAMVRTEPSDAPLPDPVTLATPPVQGRRHPEQWAPAPRDWRVPTFDHWLPRRAIEKVQAHMERHPRKVACLLVEGDGVKYRARVNQHGAVTFRERK